MNVRITPNSLSGTISAISSKSYAHRALICAALCEESSVIRLNTSSDDIEATVSCLNSLGANIERKDNSLFVEPITKKRKAQLNCNESGSTLRFLLPVAAALGTKTEFLASGKLPERPLSPLKEEMERHGIEFSEDFPLKIKGQLTAGEYNLSGNVSSQFISGLLLALPLLNEDSRIALTSPLQSKPYADMTIEVLKAFGIYIAEEPNAYVIKGNQRYKATDFTVEGDWSNASYFLALGAKVGGLKINSKQGDRDFLRIMSDFGAKINYRDGFVWLEVNRLHGVNIDAENIPDLVPLLAVIAATADGKTTIYNASRLRLKESDRIESTYNMLKNLGADIKKTNDGFEITGKEMLSGGETDSFFDHRIVMAAAVASCRCKNEVIIKNAEAVNKSYPKFFDDFNSIGGKAECQ